MFDTDHDFPEVSVRSPFSQLAAVSQMRKHLCFIAHAQKRALENEVVLELHCLLFLLRIGDVGLRKPHSVWDAEVSNEKRAFGRSR